MRISIEFDSYLFNKPFYGAWRDQYGISLDISLFGFSFSIGFKLFKRKAA